MVSGVASADVWQYETNSALECDYCALQFPTSTSVNVTSENIFGRIYEAGITEAAGASPGVLAQLGVGPAGSDPRTTPGWTWSAATFNVQVGNDDEYQGTFQGYSLGQQSYMFRFSLDAGSAWSLGDLNGAGSNGGVDFEVAQLGFATVTAAVPEPSEHAMMIAGLAVLAALGRRRV